MTWKKDKKKKGEEQTYTNNETGQTLTEAQVRSKLSSTIKSIETIDQQIKERKATQDRFKVEKKELEALLKGKKK